MWQSRINVLTTILGLTLLCQTLCAIAEGNVPVLIWGHEKSVESNFDLGNPFEKTSQVEFGKMISKIRGESENRPIIVFSMENFCIEDVTQHKKDLKDLHTDGEVIYVPMVNSPLSVFEELPLYNESLDEMPETVSQGQVMRVDATDLTSAVANFKKFKKSNSSAIAVFTGESCSWSVQERTRRAVSQPDSSAPGEIVKTDEILFYYAVAPTLTVEEKETVAYELVEVKPEVNVTAGLEFVYSVPNATNPTNASVFLRMYNESSGYYGAKAFFQNGEKEIVRIPTQSYFVFQKTFSYRCSGNVRFSQKRRIVKNEEHPGIDFVLSNFQIQVGPKKNNFDFAYDCVGFTSVPIWSGLFVTLILGLIMIWGLIMIMDIRTMDRFDDPKGKTITITASE